MNFPLLDEATAPKESLPALATTKENFCMIPNVEKVMALSPQLLSAYAHMWDLFETTTFTPVERQVVYMTANFENECNYCVPWHCILAGSVGKAARSGTPYYLDWRRHRVVYRKRLCLSGFIGTN